MYYDTQVIYSNRPSNPKNFSWDGEVFYRTAKGTPKKENKEGKKVTVSETEFQEAQKQFNFVFDTTLSL